MSEVLRLSLSVARSGWQAAWNRTFRLSRFPAGLLWLLAQVAAAALVAHRVPPAPEAAGGPGIAGMAALTAVQMGWFGLLYGFARGQVQLYHGLMVPLVQITPARPAAFLLGRLIEALPQRAWVALLWAWAYAGALPGHVRWAALPALFGAGVTAGMLALLSGMLLLTLWSRVSPRSISRGSALLGGATLALFAAMVIHILRGGTVQDLALLVERYRLPVAGAVLAAAGIPGAALLAALVLRPAAVEDLYRQGLYRVLELEQRETRRPGRSLWLPAARSGVLRAVLSREWLYLARSPLTRVQLALFAAGVACVVAAGWSAAGEPASHAVPVIAALSVQTWFVSLGHLPVRTFEAERAALDLYRLAAVPAPHLIAAKLLSIGAPSALLVSLAAAAGGLAAGLDLPDLARAVLLAVLAAAGGIAGGVGMAAATARHEPDEPSPGRAAEAALSVLQQSGSWAAVVRTLTAIAGAGMPLWAGAGRPGLSDVVPAPLAWAAALGLPLISLAAGISRLTRTWRG